MVPLTLLGFLLAQRTQAPILCNHLPQPQTPDSEFVKIQLKGQEEVHLTSGVTAWGHGVREGSCAFVLGCGLGLHEQGGTGSQSQLSDRRDQLLTDAL